MWATKRENLFKNELKVCFRNSNIFIIRLIQINLIITQVIILLWWKIRVTWIRYYIDHYLSKSDLGKACNIFDKIDFVVNDEYVSKFKAAFNFVIVKTAAMALFGTPVVGGMWVDDLVSQWVLQLSVHRLRR